MTTFLPELPLHVNPIALFGLTLLLGLIGGEIARFSRVLPPVTGYIAVGLLVGPSGLNIVTPVVITDSRIFVEISLGLVLFDIGRHLDFLWLRRDHALFLMSVSEASLSFIFVFILLFIFQLSWFYAALGATIIMITSPAVLMMVANDINSQGPVTRRSFILTSLNNLYGITLFTLLAPFAQKNAPVINVLGECAYRFVGSILLGVVIFILTIGIARFIGKRKTDQFVLFVGMVVFAIGLAEVLKLSSMLVLFILGVAARNFDEQHVLAEIDFGWLARIFFILLFVITGVHLQFIGMQQATFIVLALVLARIFAKTIGIWLFAKRSRLTYQQAWAMSLALMPMAGVAIGMANILLDLDPHLGHRLLMIVLAVVTILDILGPIATQFAFIHSGEAAHDDLQKGNM